jgi:hypothetical protein
VSNDKKKDKLCFLTATLPIFKTEPDISPIDMPRSMLV